MTRTALTEALRRDAATLLQAYRTGRWVPDPAEGELAEGLARGRWNGPFFRAALRQVPPPVRSGRLIDILAPAAEVLGHASVDADQHLRDLVLPLRVLIDALTTPS